eukprot:TRINITY_DN171_c0_g2_i1.p1 TRINITY_DN171_c0_g2~~TRINITY_DN171_c0_g2_i1.p1  ORF type:complete len:106 (+),score=21.31 TRINITY_DN171_c0_g2_i1:191-508(+)
MPHSSPPKTKKRFVLRKVSEETRLLDAFSRMRVTSPSSTPFLTVKKNPRLMELDTPTPDLQRKRLGDLARYRINLRNRSLHYRLLNKRIADRERKEESKMVTDST